MAIVTDEVDLPDVQPKGFKPAVLVSPTNHRNGNHIHFSHDTATPHKSNKGGNNIGLSLRRVTPDKRSANNLTSPSNNSSSDGNSSFVSRLTGRNSIYTGATPVMRGGRQRRGGGASNNSNGNTGSNNNTSRGRSPTSIERQQKLQDEYYRPARDEEEEDEEAVEELDDGELPSLKRVGSAGSRSRSGSRLRGNHLPLAPPSSPAAQAAATAAAMVTPISMKKRRSNQKGMIPMDDKDFETLKVAGFWSQLDDDNTFDSEEEKDRPAVNNYIQQPYQEEEEEDEGEEMPDDEQLWRQRSHEHQQYQQEQDQQQQQHRHQNDEKYRALDSTEAGEPNKNWNLLQKAACFANDNPALDEDEEEEEEEEAEEEEIQDKGNNNDEDSYFQEDDESRDSRSVDRPSLSQNRTFQTSATEGTTTQGGTANIGNDEDNAGVLGCIAAALGTICGYELYNHATSNDKDENKEKALKIIERDNRRKVENQQQRDEYYDAKQDDGRDRRAAYISAEYADAIAQHDDEYDENDEEDDIFDERPDRGYLSEPEDAAIELQYLSRDGTENYFQEPELNVMSDGEDDPISPAKLVTSAAAATPTSHGKRKLKLKSVRNLLGRGKNKKAAIAEQSLQQQELQKQQARAAALAQSPPRKTAVTTTTISGKEPVSGTQTKITDAFSSPGSPARFANETEDIMEEDNDKNNTSIPSLHSIPDYEDKSVRRNKRSIFDDDEELESQSAAWSANRKTSYLRELAERAKQDYRAKKAAENDIPSIDSRAAASASPGVVDMDSSADDTGVPAGLQSPYNADYNSFNPTEKRQFLRLLNSGMSPNKAAYVIAEERQAMHRSTEEEEEDENDNTIEENKEEEEEDDKYDELDEDFPKERPDIPMDETVLSADPPGDVLQGFSGESAELSYKDMDENDRRYSAMPYGMGNSDQVSPLESPRNEQGSMSEIGVNNDSKSSQGAYRDVAAIPLVPAIVRTRSKSSTQGKESPEEQDHQQQDKQEEETNEEDYATGDGLISYYDEFRRSDERDTNEDSCLLGKDKVRGGAKKSKRPSLGVPSLASKVASRRHLNESPSNRSSSRYAPVHVAAATHAASPSPRNKGYGQPIPIKDDNYVAAASPSSGRLGGRDDRETKSDFNKSSKSLSSALTFMQRNSKWTKLDSDLDLDGTFSKSIEKAEDIPVAYDHNTTSQIESRNLVEASPGDTGVNERRVITPTFESQPNKGYVSPDESDVQTASRAVSMLVSPDTSSLFSPQESESVSEIPGQNNVEDFDMDSVASPFRPAGYSPYETDASDVTPRSQNISAPVANSNLPLLPVSPDENLGYTGGENGSLMEQSYMTTGSTWTTASKSSRIRHKGAASKRLSKAKEAESHAGAKSKGWLGSIREVSSTRNQAWDPEKGWVDYTEPEHHYGHGDVTRIGSLHLSKTIASKKVHRVIEEENLVEENIAHPKAVEFPVDWKKEREAMIESDESAKILSSASDAREDMKLLHDDDSVFTSDATTVNTANESLMSYSTAPTRRSAPKHRSKDKRKVISAQAKHTGWKESMEAATANISDGDHQWNYEKGWVEDYDKTDDDDDVSELTKLTSLERSPQSKIDCTPVESEPVSPSYQLPSVAEELDEADSKSLMETDNNIGMNGSGEDERALSSIAPEDASEDASADVSEDNSEDYSKDNMNELPLLNENKENEKDKMSPNSDQKPPLPKRSLNQWLDEKSTTGIAQSPDAESEGAVNISDESTSENLPSEPPQFTEPVLSALEPSDHLDEVDEPNEASIHDVKVLKEKCSDTDNDLFRSSNVSESFNNRFSDSQGSELVMESFESTDSAENTWLKPTPQKDELSVVSERSEDGSRSVSSRARAWMSSMEKAAIPTAEPLVQRDTQNGDSSGLMNSPTGSAYTGTLNQRPGSGNRVAKKQSPLAAAYLNAVSTRETTPKEQNAEEVKHKPETNERNDTDILNAIMEESNVVFRSTAMGIRLKRGDDGYVRVVSVTEAAAGSSIERDGAIEPDDIVREAAGIDLRQPITNSQWGEVVTKIRSAPRPMTFVITSSSSSRDETKVEQQPMRASPLPEGDNPNGSSEASHGTRRSNNIHRPISPYSPTGEQQILNSVAEAVAKREALNNQNSIPLSITNSKLSLGTSVSSIDEPNESNKPNGFFKRIASCSNPGGPCTQPDNSNETNEVPLSHLAFLRTNPTIVRVKDAASRRYPAMCGRPDTIFEEPDESEKERNVSKSLQAQTSRTYSSIDRSATSSTLDGSKILRNPSATSSGSGDNTAFLEKIAMKSAVSNKPRANQSQPTVNKKLQHLGNKPSYGRRSPQGNNEVGWPDDNDEPEYSKDNIDSMSSYSSTLSHSSFQSNRKKKDTARQAELLAAAKVEAMMHELKDVDSMEQCEI